MRARTWNLRLNLDEFNGLVTSLYADQDRALALQGLSLGCNAGTCPQGVPEAFRRGWELGKSWREEAENYRAVRSENGKKAHPLPTGSPTGECGAEPAGKPTGAPNPQSTILLTNNQNPVNPTSKASHSELPSTPHELSDPPKAVLPCSGKGPKAYPITQTMLDEWKDVYPGTDPLQEAKKMKLWLEANPMKQKTYRGMSRFIYSWLDKAQNSSRVESRAVFNPPRTINRPCVADADFLEQLSRTSFGEAS